MFDELQSVLHARRSQAARATGSQQDAVRDDRKWLTGRVLVVVHVKLRTRGLDGVLCVRLPRGGLVVDHVGARPARGGERSVPQLDALLEAREDLPRRGRERERERERER